MTKSTKIDLFIAFAISSNILIALLQMVLLHIFQMPEGYTTMLRVALVAGIMVPAILICFVRRPVLFCKTYFLVFLLLFLSAAIFPDNLDYIKNDAIRFLLPVVIPCALCLMCLPSIDVFEKAMSFVSWISFAIVILFVLAFLSGRIQFIGYSMMLSYSLLLPAVFLYSQKTKYSIAASAIIILFVLIIGSRGALVAFFSYVIIDVVMNNKKLVIPMGILGMIALAFLPLLASVLKDAGITSRTLLLFTEGSIDYDSGRSALSESVNAALLKNPIIGLGFWGDRTVLHGVYCHSVILEICVNFGFFIGISILLSFGYWVLRIFSNSDKKNRNIVVKYFCALFIPFLVSGSYLTNYSSGLLIGLLYLVSRGIIRKTHITTCKEAIPACIR